MNADLANLGLFETCYWGVELFQNFQCTIHSFHSSPAVGRAFPIKADSKQVVCMCPCINSNQQSATSTPSIQTPLSVPFPAEVHESSAQTVTTILTPWEVSRRASDALQQPAASRVWYRSQQQHQFYLIVITEISVELIQDDTINIYFIITKCKQFCS